jgi:hypothetical protein
VPARFARPNALVSTFGLRTVIETKPLQSSRELKMQFDEEALKSAGALKAVFWYCDFRVAAERKWCRASSTRVRGREAGGERAARDDIAA